MSRKALLAGLMKKNPGLPGELAKVSVAADLTVLVAECGISRSDLAKKLGWSRARVSQVLSGESNLTIETIHAVAKAAGFAFDVVFRNPAAVRAPQIWERSTTVHVLADSDLYGDMPVSIRSQLKAENIGAMEFRVAQSSLRNMPAPKNHHHMELADAA